MPGGACGQLVLEYRLSEDMLAGCVPSVYPAPRTDPGNSMTGFVRAGMILSVDMLLKCVREVVIPEDSTDSM